MIDNTNSKMAILHGPNGRTEWGIITVCDDNSILYEPEYILDNDQILGMIPDFNVDDLAAELEKGVHIILKMEE